MTLSVANAISDDGNLTGALGNYLRTFAEPNLFLNYEMVPLATEAEVPGNQGRWMQIPYFTNDTDHGVKTMDAIAAAKEALPLATTTNVGDVGSLRDTEVLNTDRAMSYFADGFKVSKAYKSLANVRGEMERMAQFIMKTTAQTQEKLLQNQILYGGATATPDGATTDPGATPSPVLPTAFSNNTSGQISGECYYVAPGADNTPWGSIDASDPVIANNFALARKFLKQGGNPGFTKLGGKLAAVVGPDTVYRLHTQVVAAPSSGVGDAPLTWEAESMGETRIYKDAVIGDLFGFRLMECNFPITIAAGATNGPSDNGTATVNPAAEIDCELNILFAPDALYVTPHALLTPQIYVSGFNEGGAFNPTKSVASVATDFMFGALRGPDYLNKCVLMPCPVYT